MIPFPELPHIVIATASERDSHTLLFPGELDIAESFSSERRKKDFMLGRKAAHKALGALNISSPILRDTRGIPVWPATVVGSIAHLAGWGLAAVAKADEVHVLGLDLVEVDERPLKIVPRVTTKEEQKHIFSTPDPKGSACTLFSIKESLYKALYPLCNRYIGFQEIQVFLPQNQAPKIVLSSLLQSDIGRELSLQCSVSRNDLFITSVVYEYRPTS